MTVREAARKILEEAGEALHYKEITRRAVQQGLWHPKARRPEATVVRILRTDIRNKGEDSLFQRVRPGIYALRTRRRHDAVDPLAHPLRTGGRYSYTDAAERVLKQAQDKQPMHYADITRRALDEGLIEPSARTPKGVNFGCIRAEIKRAKARGDPPRFVMHGRGYIGLTEWLGTGLPPEIEPLKRSVIEALEQYNRRVRQELRKRLYDLQPHEFEATAAELLAAIGFEDVVVTGRAGDGGIDVRGVLVISDAIRTKMAVQAKKWRKNVQARTVREVRGGLGAHEQGLIITTSDFSKGARTEAEQADKVPVGLMNGSQMAALFVEHGIGVEKTSFDILELAEQGLPDE